MFKWSLLISITSIFIFFLISYFRKKQQQQNIRTADDLWERLLARKPTEKDLQDLLTENPKYLSGRIAQRLLEIGQERWSFLLIAVYGEADAAVEGWKRFFQESSKVSIHDMRWLIKSVNPKIRERATEIIIAHCEELLKKEDFEDLSRFKWILKDIMKDIPSKKESAQLVLIEGKIDILEKITTLH